MFVAIGSGCLLWLLTIYRHELNRIGGLLDVTFLCSVFNLFVLKWKEET